MDYVKLGKDPINAEAPAGSDARYEPEFETLQAEIDKLSSPTASGGVDWKKVGDLSAQILAEKSKDLLVASYFAVSQVRTDKTAGLTVGLTVMHDLVANFWDQLFPAKKRMRGRLSAFEWWLEKTMSILEDQDVPPIAAEAQEAMITNLDGLDALLSEHMPEPPMLIKLKRYVERLSSEAAAPSPASEADAPAEPEESPPVSAEPQTPATPKPLPAQQAEQVEPDEGEMDANVLTNSGLKFLNQAADILNEADWSDARAYRIRRQAAWISLDALPADTEGKTMVPVPPPTTVQALGNIREQGAWADLLKAAEANLFQFIFWMDLNRMVAEALAGLGSAYQSAHDTVCLETAYFVHRFPGITSLTFATGTPFADADTIAWLKDIAFGAGMAMDTPISPAGSAGSDGEEDRMTEIFQEAQNLAKKKKIVEAVGLMQKEMQSAVAQKETMLWRMSLCQMMMAAKRAPAAMPQLELIIESIDRFQLETWDPELALKALKIVWQGYKAQKSQDNQKKATVVLNRINRLNPVEALGLK